MRVGVDRPAGPQEPADGQPVRAATGKTQTTAQSGGLPMTAWTETIGWLVTAVAVTGVVCNNHRLRACFLLWMLSNAASAAIHVSASLWALAARDVIFFALSIHGLKAWSKPRT